MGRLLPRLLLVMGALATTVGCATAEGARLYQSGTKALERGDAERATRDLTRAAELVPHASEIQNHLGLAHLAEGRTDDARVAFERAVLLDCDNESARHNLAVLLGEEDDTGVAASPRASARPAAAATP